MGKELFYHMREAEQGKLPNSKQQDLEMSEKQVWGFKEIGTKLQVIVKRIPE